MKLSERHRPRTLDDVLGQPNILYLKALAKRPRECCVLLEGPPGNGKTSTAYALARELGAESEYSGLHVVDSASLTIDRCKDLFRMLHYTPLESVSGWKVLLIEELEALPSQTVGRFLKVALEQLPPKTIVAATSNGAAGIDKAMLQRFKMYFFGSGPDFVAACMDRLPAIWDGETNVPLPQEWQDWGWRGGEFSMRCALDDMEDAIEAALV